MRWRCTAALLLVHVHVHTHTPTCTRARALSLARALARTHTHAHMCTHAQSLCVTLLLAVFALKFAIGVNGIVPRVSYLTMFDIKACTCTCTCT